ncbi:unnamed protein product, partial [Brassica rapa subsp. trilocularis]
MDLKILSATKRERVKEEEQENQRIQICNFHLLTPLQPRYWN